MKKIVFILTAVLTTFLTSCHTDDFNQNTKGSELREFHLAYSVSKNLSATTRASIPLEEGEDNINTLYILFFEYTTGGTGQFIEAIDAKQENQQTISSSGNIKVEFPKGSGLNNQTDYNMLFCANIQQYTNLRLQTAEDFKEQFTGYTENQVLASLLNIQGVDPQVGAQEEQSDNSNRIKISDLPMSAKVFKAKNETNITVELTRTLSRFDVFCQANGYELVSASLWNAMTVTPIWEGMHRDFSEDRTQRFYGVAANENKEITGSLYAFENYVASPGQNDKKTTCLIIGLKNIQTEEIEYFRANIHANYMSQQLKRNNIYRSTVRSVNSQGAENERKAYENAQCLIDLDINGWTLDDSGNFHHDGENILAIPTRLINLSPLGETREYNVFTLGEGDLTISHIELPENITAQLRGNLLEVTASPCKTYGEGIITLGFGILSGHIIIRQQPLECDFLDLSTYKLPLFSPAAGEVTPDIQVTSSGTWIAEIYSSDYISFSPEAIQVKTMQGEPGESFNLYTILANTNRDIRNCFVMVSLQDTPEVSRVILLGQEGEDPRYIRFSPAAVPHIAAAGGTTATITIESDSPWTAELTVITGEDGGFNGSLNTKTISGNGEGTFKVTLPAHYTSSTPHILITATITDSQISAELDIYQSPFYEGVLVAVNTDGNGSLVNPGKTAYTRYVYNLGENMRNTELFGKGGTLVHIPQGGYQFVESFREEVISEAKIIQVSSYPQNTVEMPRVYNAMQQDKAKLLIIGHDEYTVTDKSLKQFETEAKAGYGSIVKAGASSSTVRTFNPDIDPEHPLISYLLGGPAGQANRDEIELYGPATTTNGGLKAGTWPDTFIPIIMSKGYCVLGIDPTHRLILMTDPGIFGSYGTGSTYKNRENYTDSESANTVFLNNFIAWMTNTAVKGEDFLKDFQ